MMLLEIPSGGFREISRKECCTRVDIYVTSGYYEEHKIAALDMKRMLLTKFFIVRLLPRFCFH